MSECGRIFPSSSSSRKSSISQTIPQKSKKIISKKSFRKKNNTSDIPNDIEKRKISQKPPYLKSVVVLISTGNGVNDTHTVEEKDEINFHVDEVKIPSNKNRNVYTADGIEINCKCPECDYRTISSSHLQRHINTVHEAEKYFNYQKLDNTLSASGDLKNHLVTKDERLKSYKYECSASTETGLRKSMDAAHKGVRLDERQQKDDREDQAATLRKDVPVNREGRKTYKCQQCEYRAVFAVNLRWHIDAFHSNAVIGRLPHQCPECNYRAARVSRLRKHVAIVHEKIKPLCCPMCDYKASLSLPLRKHLMTVHGKERGPTISKE